MSLSDLIQERKSWNSILGINQEIIDKRFDRINKVIEKNQINQSINQKEVVQSNKKIKKQKI